MKKLFIAMLVVLTGSLTGCAAVFHANEKGAKTQPKTLYDARLTDTQSGVELSVEKLAQMLVQADVVVIGEYHGHQAGHLLQSQIQAALYRQKPLQMLSMEQFNLDNQVAIDAYLGGETGETEFIEDSGAWDNYRASYRPLVEFARQHGLPVVAANAPATIVRCVGRTGPDYLNKLPTGERAQLPEKPFRDTPAYRDKFEAAITSSHGAESGPMRERMNKTYQAQLLRDNTMADRILTALKTHPGYQIVHTTGTFHSEEHLGTIALLKQRAPGISIAVISPVVWPAAEKKAPWDENRGKGDFLYFIQPLPQEFLDEDRKHKAMAARFHRTTEDTCQGDSP